MHALSAVAVLMVDRVEPTRDFFARAGFRASIEVPDGERLGFALLQKDSAQVMVQTRGNRIEPAPMQALSRESRRAVVFIEVDELDVIVGLLAGAKVAVERHTTPYGADEITYEEPGGNVVTFAKLKRE